MKSRILLCLGLCLLLLGCTEDEPVSPTGLNVTMTSSSQTLVEGGDAVELTVELDRTYNEIRYLYLDYGAANGEYPDFFESALQEESIQVKVQNEDRWVLRIPFLAGEQQKVIRLHAAENDLYRGNRPLELKVLSYEQGRVQHKAEMKLGFEEKTPKPIFGIFAKREVDTTSTVLNGRADYLILNVTTNARFIFPQKIDVTVSGTAVEGEHFEMYEPIVFSPQMSYPAGHFTTRSFAVLRVLKTGNFDPAKTIKVKLTAAEEGEIASGQEFTGYQGDKFTLGNTYSLTVTN